MKKKVYPIISYNNMLSIIDYEKLIKLQSSIATLSAPNLFDQKKTNNKV